MPTVRARLASSIAAGLVLQQGTSEGTPIWVYICGLLIAVLGMAVYTFLRERKRRR